MTTYIKWIVFPGSVMRSPGASYEAQANVNIIDKTPLKAKKNG
jgi:hypothetical protein